ncbi:MAG: hypothetical protein Q4D76_12270 [Oscillospiraceae bacterium]|nr:hypothetical protein [Oscillospiraceae bacterium]
MSYIACLCEGAAEQAVIELLLDAEKLIFTRDDLEKLGNKYKTSYTFARR